MLTHTAHLRRRRHHSQASPVDVYRARVFLQLAPKHLRFLYNLLEKLQPGSEWGRSKSSSPIRRPSSSSSSSSSIHSFSLPPPCFPRNCVPPDSSSAIPFDPYSALLSQSSALAPTRSSVDAPQQSLTSFFPCRYPTAHLDRSFTCFRF
jgi:hypothetical protein